jgi:phosphatidylglycerol:prolipoprotein diacylglycerol transferase
MTHLLADIPFPSFDPVAVEIGPVAVRWYGLAYLAAFAIGYGLLRRMASKGTLRLAPAAVGDLVTWLIVGVMVGGRLGWWLVYDRADGGPWWEPLAIWQGGMSFHGGLVGVAVALLLFARVRRVRLWNVADGLALVTPFGLLLGRLANFVNAELVGRPTKLPWGVVFPGETIARHPSQLYEALLEGVILGGVLWIVFKLVCRRRDGDLALLFIGLYGIFRFAVEFTRQPDPQVGFIAFDWLTMGQLLSAAMTLAAVAVWVVHHRPTTARAQFPRSPVATAIPLMFLAVTLTGCASESDDNLLDRLRQSAREATPLAVGPTQVAPADVAEASGPEDYARLAVAANLRVVAAEARARRLAARVPQARSLDDPMLQVMPIGAMAETAAGQVQATVGLSQKLPLPQKLNARAEAARRETAAALAELERVKLEVAAEARQAFWRYWLADRAIDVTRQSRDLLADLQEAATAQLRAGRVGQADVLRAATELAALDNELIDLELDRDVAAAALNRLLDRPVAAPLPAPPEVMPDVPPLDATADNPRIAARLAEIDAAKQRLRLARLNDWPDLTIMASYGFVDDDGLAVMANGDDQWSLGFGINLPIYRDKRRAEVREQLAAVLEGQARLNAETNDIAFEVREAVAEVEAQQRLVELFDETVIPQARQTVEATAAAYRAGNADFLAYVDAWRRLLDFELAQKRATSALGRAAADLNLALGKDTTHE